MPPLDAARMKDVPRFVTYLAQIVAYKTINLYLTAVKHYAICKGYLHDFQKMHQLHLLLRGTKRALGALGKRKPHFPVTIPKLRIIRSFIQSQYLNPRIEQCCGLRVHWHSLPFFAVLNTPHLQLIHMINSQHYKSLMFS